jgi:hypothetical protein
MFAAVARPRLTRPTAKWGASHPLVRGCISDGRGWRGPWYRLAPTAPMVLLCIGPSVGAPIWTTSSITNTTPRVWREDAGVSRQDVPRPLKVRQLRVLVDWVSYPHSGFARSINCRLRASSPAEPEVIHAPSPGIWDRCDTHGYQSRCVRGHGRASDFESNHLAVANTVCEQFYVRPRSSTVWPGCVCRPVRGRHARLGARGLAHPRGLL